MRRAQISCSSYGRRAPRLASHSALSCPGRRPGAQGHHGKIDGQSKRSVVSLLGPGSRSTRARDLGATRRMFSTVHRFCRGAPGPRVSPRESGVAGESAALGPVRDEQLLHVAAYVSWSTSVEVQLMDSRRTFLHWTAGRAAVPAVRVSRGRKADGGSFPPGGRLTSSDAHWPDKLKPLLGTVVIENIGGGGASAGAPSIVRVEAGYTTCCSAVRRTSRTPCSKPATFRSGQEYRIQLQAWPPMVSSSPCTLGPGWHAQGAGGCPKPNPGKLSYGHAGVSSIQHLTGELLKSLADTPEHGSYRGTGPAMATVIGVPMGIVGVTGAMLEFHRTGKTRIVAIADPLAPDLQRRASRAFPGSPVMIDCAGGELRARSRNGSRSRSARGGRRAPYGAGRARDRARAQLDAWTKSNTRWRRILRSGHQSVKALGLKLD